MQSFVQNVEITVKQTMSGGSSDGGQAGSISMRCKRRQTLSYFQADVRSLCLGSLVLCDLHSQSGLGSHSAYPLATKAAIRSSPPEVFLKKGVQKVRSKFTGEHTCPNFALHFDSYFQNTFS